MVAPASTTTAAMRRFHMRRSVLKTGQSPFGKLDPPNVRVAVPLGGLQIELELARYVVRSAQLLVHLREGPVDVRVVGFVGCELDGKWSHRRKVQLGLERLGGLLQSGPPGRIIRC